MFSNFKKKVKSATTSIQSSRSTAPSIISVNTVSRTPSIQSSTREHQNPANKSCPALVLNQPPPVLTAPPPIGPHLVGTDESEIYIHEITARRREKMASSNTPTHNSSSSDLSESGGYIDHNSSGLTSSSSSSSLASGPTTPPPTAYIHSHKNNSRFSIRSFSSDTLMNHTHLKPGQQAELLAYEKTITMYRENAKRTNNPDIQCDLAIYLFQAAKGNPKEHGQHLGEVEKMLKTLALRGHAESQYYLANMYASGVFNKSGKPNFGSAFPLFVQAAKHQHSDGAYRAAKCYEDGLGCLKNKNKAVQYYKLAATLNHPGAMYRLGLADINGNLGLSRNVKDGNKWLKRAAEAATPQYPHALHELGLLHEKGLDNIIFKDAKYSIQLYARAASLGYAPSATRLGEVYEYGYLECQRDAAASVYYYTIAARQGVPEACFALSAWYLAGEKDVLAASEEKAFHWASVAAEKHSHAKSQFALGYFSEVGIGCTENQNKAMAWYKKAAEQGDEQARHRLTTGKLIEKPAHHAVIPPAATLAV